MTAEPGRRPPVTLAVVNARVWTGDPRRPWADAVVVRGDQLAFVGSAAEARKLTRDAPGAQLIDAHGAFVTARGDGRVLRSGETADFVLVADDPSRPAPDAPAVAPPTLVVDGGQVVVRR